MQVARLRWRLVYHGQPSSLGVRSDALRLEPWVQAFEELQRQALPEEWDLRVAPLRRDQVVRS